MSNLIDTHFHLDHYRNYMELAEKINALKQYTICVTNSPGVFLSCKKMFQETQYLKFAIGFHPQEESLSQDDLRDFMLLMDRTNYVGEIGVDFSRSSPKNRDSRLATFEKIVSKCAETNKLMTVHSRGAEEEILEIIKRYMPKRCIMHWYTGAEKHIAEFIDAGCYFSVNSNMVDSKSNSKYRNIPKDRILVESDGPYTRVDGKKYTPVLLHSSYEKIARFYADRDLVQTVYDNFKSILTA